MHVTIDAILYIIGLVWQFEIKISFIAHNMNITGEVT
jgi:hypothetical protein